MFAKCHNHLDSYLPPTIRITTYFHFSFMADSMDYIGYSPETATVSLHSICSKFKGSSICLSRDKWVIKKGTINFTSENFLLTFFSLELDANTQHTAFQYCLWHSLRQATLCLNLNTLCDLLYAAFSSQCKSSKKTSFHPHNHKYFSMHS